MSKICGTSATRGGPNLLRITSPAQLAFSSANVIHRRLLLASCRRFLPPTFFRLVSRQLRDFLPLCCPPPPPSLTVSSAYLNQNFATPRSSSLYFPVFSRIFRSFLHPAFSPSYSLTLWCLALFLARPFVRQTSFPHFSPFHSNLPFPILSVFYLRFVPALEPRLFHLFRCALLLSSFPPYSLFNRAPFLFPFAPSVPQSSLVPSLYIYPIPSFYFPSESVLSHIYPQHVVLLLLALEPKFVYHSTSFHGIAARVPETNVYKRRSPFRVIPCS